MIDLREELAQRVTLRDDMFDFEGELPEMSAELDDCHWQGAEPDVGIMSEYLDDYSVSGNVGNATFEGDALIEAVWAAVEPHVTDTREEVAAMLQALIEKEAADMEPPEPDYDDDWRGDDD